MAEWLPHKTSYRCTPIKTNKQKSTVCENQELQDEDKLGLLLIVKTFAKEFYKQKYSSVY